MDSTSVDFVITWVDGDDAVWKAEKAKYQYDNYETGLAKWNDGSARYREWGTLRYWFRGVEAYAPWVNKIHFVTWGHVPAWLNKEHPKLNIIYHHKYIPAQYLPTFNSHCIELNLHRIPGLSERFVYFNDDMLLTAPTISIDFFKKGLPCGSAILSPVDMTQNGIRAEINDLYVINRFFIKNKVIVKDPLKWFTPCYGKQLLKTLLLMPFHRFSGFYILHIPGSYLKQTFSNVWDIAGDILDDTCKHRFRTSTDVNQWLFEYWQYATGFFTPRSPSIGAMYEGLDTFDSMCTAITNQKYKMICFNDSCDIIDFISAKEMVLSAFEKILPDISSFEIE